MENEKKDAKIANSYLKLVKIYKR